MTHSYSGLQTWRQIIYRLQLPFLFFCFSIASAQPTVVFHEDFEGSWTDNWYVDAGTWEVGTPGSGPGNAYDGANCAGTALEGNYSQPVATRLIRYTSFTVPDATENPRFRFWYWFSFSTNDYGEVQISTDYGTTWETISVQMNNQGGKAWSYASIDLSDYAGQAAQIAFYFHSANDGNSYTNDVSTGWYIDDVSLITGDYEFNYPEGFEAGFGDWSVDEGTWEVGIPEAGPSKSNGGEKCAGTTLAGNYQQASDSRLVSPYFVVPDATENPRFRFWYWFSFSTNDYGEVQISTDSGTTWETISVQMNNQGGKAWSYACIDLSEYAGQRAQLAFYFHSADDGNSYTNDVSTGWYIDDVLLCTGNYEFNNPEGFEAGFGDWSVDEGTWEVGVPEAGPADSYGGEKCAGTTLAGNYQQASDSRLVSPPLAISSAETNPGVQFWHWFSNSTNDYGEVQISTDEGTTWETVSTRFENTSSDSWTPYYFSLSPYANDTILIGFYFHSGDDGNSYTNDISTGWYIDDISIQGLATDIGKKVEEQNSGLLKTAPNPFSSTTQISYVIINTEYVSLIVYNELGQNVATLVNGVQEPGKHSVVFNSSGLPVGIYFYQLQYGNSFSDTQKMIKISK